MMIRKRFSHVLPPRHAIPGVRHTIWSELHAEQSGNVELAAIAVVFLSGAIQFGGKAAIFGTFSGALLIGIIINGLIIMGLDVSEHFMFLAGLIMLAVAFARWHA